MSRRRFRLPPATWRSRARVREWEQCASSGVASFSWASPCSLLSESRDAWSDKSCWSTRTRDVLRELRLTAPHMSHAEGTSGCVHRPDWSEGPSVSVP